MIMVNHVPILMMVFVETVALQAIANGAGQVTIQPNGTLKMLIVDVHQDKLIMITISLQFEVLI